MKERFFRSLCVLAAMLCVSLPTGAQSFTIEDMDSIEIGLVTCSPHDEVYSLYGHSALHVHDLRNDSHLVYNYGVFDFRKPHFVWRFIMGKTDYCLERYSAFERWVRSYTKWGCLVEEQILNLSNTEKLRLFQALEENLNRYPVYRYNYFFDNCSTRPRNIVERCLDGKVSYAARPDYNPTFREIIHACTEGHPWAAFGNDLLLGLRADMKATQREQEFLPANLCYDFDHATVVRKDETRPLVLRHVVIAPLSQQPVSGGFPISPLACTLLILGVSIGIFVMEWRRKRTMVWWDAVLMLLTGLPGLLLLLMFFSEHPATSTNLQILLLNPVALFFLPAVIRRRRTRWFTISLFCLVAFFIGGIWQDYAEGMEIVALSLLLRYWTHRRHDK